MVLGAQNKSLRTAQLAVPTLWDPGLYAVVALSGPAADVGHAKHASGCSTIPTVLHVTPAKWVSCSWRLAGMHYPTARCGDRYTLKVRYTLKLRDWECCAAHAPWAKAAKGWAL